MTSINKREIKRAYLCVLVVCCFLHSVSGSTAWLNSEVLNLTSDLLVLLPFLIIITTRGYWSKQVASTVIFGLYIGLLALASISPLDALNEGKYFVFFMMISSVINGCDLSEADIKPAFKVILMLVIICGAILFLDPVIAISRFGFTILPGYGTTGYIGLSGMFVCAYLYKDKGFLRLLCAFVIFLSLLLIIFSGARRYLVLLALVLLIYFPVATLIFGKISKAGVKFLTAAFIFTLCILSFSEVIVYLSLVLDFLFVAFSNIDLLGGTGRFASEDGSVSEGILAQRIVQGIEHPAGVSLGNVSNDLTGAETDSTLMDGSINRILYSTGIIGFLLMATFLFHTFKRLNVLTLYKSPGVDRFLATIFIVFPLFFLVEDVYFIKSGTLTMFLLLRIAVLRSQRI